MNKPECKTYANGYKEWCLNGKLHREDGPACEYPSGTKEWYLNGKRHREDGPACENANGTKVWYLNGKRHREDGPAVEYGQRNQRMVSKRRRSRSGNYCGSMARKKHLLLLQR